MRTQTALQYRLFGYLIRARTYAGEFKHLGKGGPGFIRNRFAKGNVQKSIPVFVFGFRSRKNNGANAIAYRFIFDVEVAYFAFVFVGEPVIQSPCVNTGRIARKLPAAKAANALAATFAGHVFGRNRDIGFVYQLELRCRQERFAKGKLDRIKSAIAHDRALEMHIQTICTAVTVSIYHNGAFYTGCRRFGKFQVTPHRNTRCSALGRKVHARHRGIRMYVERGATVFVESHGIDFLAAHRI